jgi:hypothetical protein
LYVLQKHSKHEKCQFVLVFLSLQMQISRMENVFKKAFNHNKHEARA